MFQTSPQFNLWDLLYFLLLSSYPNLAKNKSCQSFCYFFTFSSCYLLLFVLFKMIYETEFFFKFNPFNFLFSDLVLIRLINICFI